MHLPPAPGDRLSDAPVRAVARPDRHPAPGSEAVAGGAPGIRAGGAVRPDPAAGRGSPGDPTTSAWRIQGDVQRRDGWGRGPACGPADLRRGGRPGPGRRSVQPSRPGEWPPRFGATPGDREAILVLSHLESLTPREVHRLAHEEGSAARCLAAIRSGAVGSAGDRDAAGRVDVRSVRAALASTRARVAYPGDPEYPPSLLELADPPACLFLRGRPLPTGPAVAVVRGRLCFPY